jgi:peptidoglycan/LPS O-acetylase OafA/YrhL
MSIASGCCEITKVDRSVVDLPGAHCQSRVVCEGKAGRKGAEESRPNPQSHPELYSLRFWAFLLVFAHHFLGPCLHRLSGLGNNAVIARLVTTAVDLGSLGVDLFFCMSSFLITRILVREFEAHGRLNIPAFLARRCLRIFPLYFGFLGLTVFVIPHFLASEHLSKEYLIPFVLFGANWVCAARGFPSSVAAPLWSVSGEQQFYLLWPALVHWLSPRRIVPMALACVGVSTIARMAVLRAGLPQPAIWANTLAHLDPIAAGALCSVMLSRKGWPIQQGARRALLALGIGLPAGLLFTLGPSVYHGPWSLLFYPASAFACGCVLAGVYREGRAAYRPSLVYLGRISYGLFVFHILAMQLTRAVTAPLLAGKGSSFKAALAGGNMVIAFGLTVGLAMLSYRYFEEPFLRYKARFRSEKSSRPVKHAGPEVSSPVAPLFLPQMKGGASTSAR